jgi:hypothetical protein
MPLWRRASERDELPGHPISSAGLPGPLEHLDLIATAAFKKGMRQNLEHLRGIVESNDAVA